MSERDPGQGRDAPLASMDCRAGTARVVTRRACLRTRRPHIRRYRSATMTSKTIRETTRVVTAHRQREGAGFIVRRPVPAPGLDVADPFLLLDEMGPVDYAPGEAVGAPDHPPRGSETSTYTLEGEFEHEDSAR